MTIERYSELIPSAGAVQLPLERGSGNFLLLLIATNPVTVTVMYDGTREVFSGVTGGLYIKRVKPWKNLRIDGAIGTQVVFFFGNEIIAQDETDIRLQIATIAGTSAVADVPAANVNDTAPINPTVSGQHVLVAANANRRRVTVSGDPGNTATVFLRKAGGVNNIGIVTPGGVAEVRGAYALDYNDPSAGGQKLYIFEEV